MIKRMALVLTLLVGVVSLWGGAQPVAQAAPLRLESPGGIVAFVGGDALAARVYVLDVASGQLGQIETPVLAEADLAWQPGGSLLAFTTTGGQYGVLTSTAGCFSSPFVCENVSVFEPETPVLGVEWSPDGAWLFLLHEDSIAVVSPLATALSVTLTVNATCANGLAVSGGEGYLLCAAPDAAGIAVSVNQFGAVAGSEVPLEPVREVGVYDAITTLAINGTGHVTVGTSEAGGESGWVSAPDGVPGRIAPNQIHMTDAGFTLDRLAVVGAIADSTGDATLRDGDVGELFLYDFDTQALTQIPGFTGATGVATVPDAESVLVVLNGQSLAFYTPSTLANTPLTPTLPVALQIYAAEWQFGEGSLPPVPSATAAALPTYTPFPTFAPMATPVPSVVPAATAPPATGCQYAYGGTGGLPFAVGDTAQVTDRGAGLRMRNGAGVAFTLLRELPRGTRMTVLNGPLCADGYRWWQFKLSDSTIGWAADSDTGGYWVTKATAETLNFWADRTTISAGECVTLQWAVEGIKEVYYLGNGTLNEGVIGTGTKNECPASTTTYSLRIIRTDGTTVIQTVTITVGATPVPTLPPPAEAFPDLYVSEFSLTPAIPVKGQAVTVKVGIYNQGTAGTGTATIHVEWWPGELFSAPACTWDVSGIPAHGGYVKTCIYTGYQSTYTPSVNPLYTLVKLDTTGVIPELDETNNSFRQLITVVAP